MPNAAQELLPLEKLLRDFSTDLNHFPYSHTDYFDRYLSIKSVLSQQVMSWVNVGLAQQEGVYTDHGVDHKKRVMKYAGELLGIGATPEAVPALLSPYEIFLLLVSILVHDAGNMQGRGQHESRAFSILKEFCDSQFPDKVEARIIADIARAHGGKYTRDGRETRDTIKLLGEQGDYGGVKYRQRLLAGLLRLADEICEDRSRVPLGLLAVDVVGSGNLIFHKYAQAIRSVHVDRSANVIRIYYELKSEDLSQLFLLENVQTYLIDFLFGRLDKMNQERIYCSRFISSVVRISGIRASIEVLNNDYEVIATQPVDIDDDGYPFIDKPVASLYLEWNGERLKERLERGELGG